MKRTIRQPLLTEKSLLLARSGWFSFVCSKAARKEEIQREISHLYGVTVHEVRTIMMHGKSHRVGRRQALVQKSDWKKALVRLAKGQTIDAFEIPKEEKKA